VPFALCSALFGGAVLQAQSITGVWRYEIPRGDGTSKVVYLDLKQDGGTVTGDIIENYHRRKFDQGTLTNGKLHGTINPWREVVITYDGKFENNQIDLTVSETRHPGDKPKVQQAVAKPSTEEEIKPPAQLPVPELHEVADNALVRTPPMGWNSWNHFAGKVSDATIRATADVMVSSGMKDAGYIYVNIDDTWEGGRDAEGNIQTNTKFPDMKALADYVHSKGLKLGIYSSPGPFTCAGYLGSYGHEEQDAKTYAAWGIDYLKYDWCSAGTVYKNEDLRPVYQKMGDALLATGRPIVYSLCEYGDGDVWTWGTKVGGNAWRTTGDIQDNWKSMSTIGFSQIKIADYPAAGHWNDPDMLEIGNGGMTDDEYRVHMTLWSLLSAPLLAGNDLSRMSQATKSILMNKEVIAINQDTAVKHPKRNPLANNTEVWTRELSDGSAAVALFNRGDSPQTVHISWKDLDLNAPTSARDLWKHADVKLNGDTYAPTVPKHGVVLLKIASH
jgi:alpha-galactosidase